MHRLGKALAIATCLASVACGGPANGRYGRPVHNPERATVASPEVSDDAFAGAVRDLLASEPHSKERALRLQGVVARQVTRAAARFRAREQERALASLSGAMYLVRSGELTTSMLGPNGEGALKGAAAELAKKGDEGRARAAYEMLSRVAPASEQSDVRAHLDAIAAWTKDTAGSGPMQVAGGLESAAVTRLLLEPSKEARDEAVARTVDFVERALAVRAARKNRGQQVTRDEGLEAVRALGTGATVLAAVHLRSADAPAALAALEKAGVREIARPDLVRALAAVVDAPDAERWLEVSRQLRPQRRRGADDEDYSRDAELLKVASFVAACEAYRLDATSGEAAVTVASVLVDLGMGEAAPAVLADAVKAQRDPRVVGVGLALTMQAMGRALDADEADTARRAFRAAQPLLAAGDAQKGKLQPSPARVYGLMGDIEIREGRVVEAAKALEAALERERTGAVLFALARIDAHANRRAEAQARLKDALGTEDGQRDLAMRAEILLLQSDVLREQGDAQGARRPLDDALRELAKARGAAQEPEDKARIERLVARALDRFGDASRAQKALDRALEAAPRDKRQAAATIGQMVSRAFLKSDLAGARDALGRGLAADLPREDVVYYAMWVRALERANASLKTPPDPTAERVLAQAEGDPRWIGRVAAFGTGKLKAEALLAAAKTPSQKAEALFYAALEKRASGDAKSAEDLLRQVAASSALDLMEMAIARELLLPAGRSAIGGPVPEVGLP
jgi:tetratricopeptide (TPR) repeat protein